MVILAVLLLVAAALVIGRPVWQRVAASRLESLRARQLPEALERMAGSLRTGSSVPQALAECGRDGEAPLSVELAALASSLSHGVSMGRALDVWTEQHHDDGTRLAASALLLAAQLGAAPGRALDGVAATLRERNQLSAERHAQATQARYSAIVLSVAPVGFTALLVISNDAASRFLLTTVPGWACLAIGLGLDAAGALWMNRLTRVSA